jgi:4'-phosphopantetheinyl transferase
MFVASRVLLRHVLSRYNATNPHRWRFRANRYGKPFVAGPSAACHLRFNLTHTEGLLAVAVTRGREIGIDAECENREVVWRSLAPTIFTDREVAHLDSLDDAEQRICFFRYWTLKEAFVKARGKGLSLSLQEFHFVLTEPGMPRIEFVDPANGQSGDWQFFLFDEFPNHQLALAVEGGQDVAVSLRPGTELL